MDDDARYQAAIESVTAAVRSAGSGARAVGRLGRKIRGTAAYEPPPGITAADQLVALRRAGDSGTQLCAGRLLPGAGAVEPLAQLQDDGWSSIGTAYSVRDMEVISLSFRAGATARYHAEAASWYFKALALNEQQVRRIRARAEDENSVFRPCLELYDQYVAEHVGESRTSQLTAHLLGAREETEDVIGTRARDKYGASEDASEATGKSISNSLRRSAGTNYQGLVALAIAEDLLEARSVWYIHYPPPREYMRRLALRFTPKPGFEVEIDPDIDILLKNSAWTHSRNRDEPVVLLSVKTSLADRAGAAARWKMYFDVATHPCPFDGHVEGCAWHDQGLRFARPDINIRLQHCIVTANIYKIGSDTRFASEGELHTAQTKANTFMFDRRYATRTGENVAMEGWEPLTELRTLLDDLSGEQQLPG